MFSSYSVSACESLEALDVILAGIHWVLRCMVLIALLHALEHSVALWLGHVEALSSKVGGEEITERWNARGTSSGTNSHHGGPSGGSWGDEESAVIQTESLHVWVLKETS